MRKGRFGPYVQHGKTVANLPRGVMMEEITLDEAVALLAEKGKQLRPRGAAGRRGRGAAAAKPEAAAGTGSGGQKPAATRERPRQPSDAPSAKAKRAAPKKAAKATAKKKAAARGKKAATRPALT